MKLSALTSVGGNDPFALKLGKKIEKPDQVIKTGLNHIKGHLYEDQGTGMMKYLPPLPNTPRRGGKTEAVNHAVKRAETGDLDISKMPVKVLFEMGVPAQEQSVPVYIKGLPKVSGLYRTSYSTALEGLPEQEKSHWFRWFSAEKQQWGHGIVRKAAVGDMIKFDSLKPDEKRLYNGGHDANLGINLMYVDRLCNGPDFVPPAWAPLADGAAHLVPFVSCDFGLRGPVVTVMTDGEPTSVFRSGYKDPPKVSGLYRTTADDLAGKSGNRFTDHIRYYQAETGKWSHAVHMGFSANPSEMPNLTDYQIGLLNEVGYGCPYSYFDKPLNCPGFKIPSWAKPVDPYAEFKDEDGWIDSRQKNPEKSGVYPSWWTFDERKDYASRKIARYLDANTEIWSQPVPIPDLKKGEVVKRSLNQPQWPTQSGMYASSHAAVGCAWKNEPIQVEGFSFPG